MKSSNENVYIAYVNASNSSVTVLKAIVAAYMFFFIALALVLRLYSYQ